LLLEEYCTGYMHEKLNVFIYSIKITCNLVSESLSLDNCNIVNDSLVDVEVAS